MPTFNNSGSAVNELNNYTYTEIGELKSDAAEEIEEIIWRVDSKISEIIRTSTSVKENLKFEYDAMGNRIAKHVFDELGVLQHSTFYVRDAQGNVMAVYEQEVTVPEGEGPPATPSITYHLTERHIYGSARLGMDRTVVEMAPTTIQAYPLEPTIPATEESARYLGRKYYELSNHLGNVLTVITDEKWMVLNGSNYSHYESVVVSVTDYSPFGVSLTGRTFTTNEEYRYGFQNQETDRELWDGAVSYKYRIEDVRLGRFFSVDPLYRDYPWNSNYAFSENRLIDGVELEGLEFEIHEFAPEYKRATVVMPSDELELGMLLRVVYEHHAIPESDSWDSGAHARFIRIPIRPKIGVFSGNTLYAHPSGDRPVEELYVNAEQIMRDQVSVINSEKNNKTLDVEYNFTDADFSVGEEKFLIDGKVIIKTYFSDPKVEVLRIEIACKDPGSREVRNIADSMREKYGVDPDIYQGEVNEVRFEYSVNYHEKILKKTYEIQKVTSVSTQQSIPEE